VWPKPERVNRENVVDMPSKLEQLMIDKERLFNLGVRSVRAGGVSARAASIRAVKYGYDAPACILSEFVKLGPIFADAMVAAHLQGRMRAVVVASEHMNTAAAFGPYSSAVDFVKKRLELDESYLNTVRAKYGRAAVDVAGEVGSTVGHAASNAMVDIVEQTMSTSDSIKYMRDVLTNVGIDVSNPWLLETMVRTQIAVAYSAGRWNANQDPAIQEILWGYEYVTVGDDRVRFEHEALDGAAYPKEHAFWQTNWPPNGYNCRCDVLELFYDDAPVTVEREGEPDEGWAVNHGLIYDDLLVGAV